MTGTAAQSATGELPCIGLAVDPPAGIRRGETRLQEPLRTELSRALGEHAGFGLPSGSEGALDDAVRRRAVLRTGGDVEAYAALICEVRDLDEIEALFDCVSVGQTSFFRSGSTISDFVRHVASLAMGRSGPIRIWSAGCASGEEVWSVAAVAMATLGEEAARLQVVGSDLSRPALERARAADYEGVPPTDIPVGLRPLFEFVDDRMSPGPRLRGLVTFERHNLVGDGHPPIEAPLDAVLFRNVGIYFPDDVVETLVSRFHDMLRPGGHLLLGRAESLWGTNHPFEVVEIGSTFAYRRPESERSAVRASLPEPSREPALAPRDPEVGADPAVDPDGGPAGRRLARPELSVAEAIARLLGHVVTGDEAASAEIERFLRARPLVAEGHYLLATVAERDGDVEEAFESYRKAVYLDSGFALGHFGAATVLEKRGMRERAAAAYEAAAACLEADPGRCEPFLESMECDALRDVCADKAMELRGRPDG